MRNRYESAIACEAVVLRQIYTIILNQCISFLKNKFLILTPISIHDTESSISLSFINHHFFSWSGICF